MVSADTHSAYLARQVATLSLSHVRAQNPMAGVRAAAWHNIAGRLGIYLPLFLMHDVGQLLTVPQSHLSQSGLAIALRPEALPHLPADARQFLTAYQHMLETLRYSDVFEKAPAWRMRDELVAVLLVKLFGDVYHQWPDPAKRVGAVELPLDPRLYDTDNPQQVAGLERGPAHEGLLHGFSFMRFLTAGTQPLSVYTSAEQIDLDTVRLLGMFTPLGGHGPALQSGLQQGAAGVQLDLLDLLGMFQSTEPSDVVNFSLDLLPSVLETKRASGVQVFSADGYASIERRGNLDSLILSEMAHDDELFEQKVIDNELYYYGHEKQRDEERRLQYILIDASPSMRGLRQVFGRGLALTLGKKLSLQGDDVWLRFFDARLHDIVRMTRSGADYATPYLLCFRSDRGRNYARVFRQLQAELHRLRSEERRQIVLYIITHGQCHIPIELVQGLARVAYLYGVFILPSTEVQLDYLPHLQRYQIVSDQILTLQKERRDRALQIVEDAAKTKSGARPLV